MNRAARAAAAVLAVAIVLAARDARAQIGRVAGTVTDEDGRAIRGATITAENRDQAPPLFTSISDARGRFSILGLRRGSWLFIVQAPGFESVETRLDVVTTRPNPPFNVKLTRGIGAAAPGPRIKGDAKEIQRSVDRAASLAAAGDHAGAIAAYRELLARVPALTSVYLELGALHERANDPAAALTAYKRLAELEPGNRAARAAVARLEPR